MKITADYDKILHTWVNYLIVKCSKELGYLPIGLGIAVVVSLCKELYDKGHGGKFDWYDIIADVSGMIMGAV